MAISFEARIPGTPLGVRMLRREMAGIAKDCGMDAEGIADVRLAVTEAATNAVIHAYAKAEGELSVTAAMQDGELAPGSSRDTTAPAWGSGSLSSQASPSG
jgi:anti-sigma regulatory factor (Ser/Thr protein kinase)